MFIYHKCLLEMYHFKFLALLTFKTFDGNKDFKIIQLLFYSFFLLFKLYFLLNNYTKLSCSERFYVVIKDIDHYFKRRAFSGVECLQLNRALCRLSTTDTDSRCVRNCRQLATQVSAYTHPSSSMKC